MGTSQLKIHQQIIGLCFEKGEKGLFGGNFYFWVETIGIIGCFWVATRTENWERAGLPLIYN